MTSCPGHLLPVFTLFPSVPTVTRSAALSFRLNSAQSHTCPSVWTLDYILIANPNFWPPGLLNITPNCPWGLMPAAPGNLPCGPDLGPGPCPITGPRGSWRGNELALGAWLICLGIKWTEVDMELSIPAMAESGGSPGG